VADDRLQDWAAFLLKIIFYKIFMAENNK